MVEKILIGIDGQDASSNAVRWVVEHVRDRPTQVDLVSMVDLLVSDIDEHRRRLEAAQAVLRSGSPATQSSTALIERGIVEGLVERSPDYDVLVIGAHAHRPVRSALTGSLPYRIAARAACATVIVPDDWREHRGTVSVGIDDDRSGDGALMFAAHEAARRGTAVQVVHGWRPPELHDPDAERMVTTERLRRHHEQLLADAVERVRRAAPGVRVTGRLEELGGEAATVRSEDSALVVLGTHHRPPEIAALLGSAALAELAAGGVPVCIVPAPRPIDSDRSASSSAVAG